MSATDHRFRRSAALPFVEARCASASRNSYIPHAHDSLSIGSVEGGESAFSLRDVERRLGPGDVVLIPPGVVHCCNPASDGCWSYRMLHLDPAWVTDVIGEWQPFAAGVFDGFPDAVLRPLVHSRLVRLTDLLFGDAPEAEKEAEVVLFVGDLYRILKDREPFTAATAASGNAGLNDALALIESRCAEPLPLALLASVAGMSRYHFLRRFRDTVGMTPHAWQIDLRIRRARVLLEQGLPLADVAAQLGFADQSHFQRAFKRRVAATPAEYRSPPS